MESINSYLVIDNNCKSSPYANRLNFGIILWIYIGLLINLETDFAICIICPKLQVGPKIGYRKEIDTYT